MLLVDLPTTRDTRRQEGAGDQCPLTAPPPARAPGRERRRSPAPPRSAVQPRPSSAVRRRRAGPGVPKPDPIVVADDVTRHFGGMTAVDVDHLEVQRGAHHGAHRPQRGRQDDAVQPAHRVRQAEHGPLDVRGPLAAGYARGQGGAVRHGAHVPADQGAVPDDGHREHAPRAPPPSPARTCSPPSCRRCGGPREREITEQAEELLVRFKLDAKRDDFAGSLSGGQRKLLEMARALMSKPTMVMLDEPMAGVNPALTQSLLGHIQALRDEGTTVLFVEHDMHMVRHISDWVVVMAEGRIVAEGPPESVMQRPGRHRRLPRCAPRHRPGRRRAAGGRRRRAARGRGQGRGGATMSTVMPTSRRARSPVRAADDGRRGPPRRPGGHPAAGRHRHRRRVPARRRHPQRLQPRGAPRRAHRDHRPERGREVDAAQGPVRSRHRPVRLGDARRARTSPTSARTPWCAAGSGSSRRTTTCSPR